VSLSTSGVSVDPDIANNLFSADSALSSAFHARVDPLRQAN
jgi:hypothetical protein